MRFPVSAPSLFLNDWNAESSFIFLTALGSSIQKSLVRSKLLVELVKR